MPLAKCPRCGALFDKTEVPVCAKCEPEEAADYGKVREVLEKIPHPSADEAAEEAGVSRDCVLRMLEQGLVQHITLNESVKCGRCGAPAISISKKLCQSCLEKLNAELAAEQSKIKLPPKKTVQVGEVMTNVRKTIDGKRKS